MNVIRRSVACKIVLLGEGGVGKTSLRKSYLGEGFSEKYAMTIGADFAAKRVTIRGWQITANIWDLAGQVRFKAMRETYYRGASGALVLYDITRPDTFDEISKWIEELKANNDGELVPIIIIGNKADLREDVNSTVDPQIAIDFSKSIQGLNPEAVQFIESSAKTGENVEKAFETLILQIFGTYMSERDPNFGYSDR